jgi:hypothetical protein
MSGYDTNASAHMLSKSRNTHFSLYAMFDGCAIPMLMKCTKQRCKVLWFMLHCRYCATTGAQNSANAVEMARPHAVIYLVKS